MAALNALEKYLSQEEKNSGRSLKTDSVISCTRTRPREDAKYTNLDLYLEYESKREPSSTLKKQEKLDDSITMEIDKFMNVRLQEYEIRRHTKLRCLNISNVYIFAITIQSGIFTMLST
jgi:hypothetical protein